MLTRSRRSLVSEEISLGALASGPCFRLNEFDYGLSFHGAGELLYCNGELARIWSKFTRHQDKLTVVFSSFHAKQAESEKLVDLETDIEYN